MTTDSDDFSVKQKEYRRAECQDVVALRDPAPGKDPPCDRQGAEQQGLENDETAGVTPKTQGSCCGEVVAGWVVPESNLGERFIVLGGKSNR